MCPSPSPAPLSREQRQRQTRDQLLATATRLFVEKGYGGASIRDIVQQAGFTQGAFYANFDSKEALLLEMLRRHMQTEAAQLATLVARDARTPAQMLDELEAWAATIDQDVNWSLLSIELQLHAQRSPAFAQAYQAVWEQHRQVLGQRLAALFKATGARPPLPVADMASSFMALAHGLALQRSATGGGAPGTVLVTLLRGLLALGKRERAAP